MIIVVSEVDEKFNTLLLSQFPVPEYVKEIHQDIFIQATVTHIAGPIDLM
jgi:hypothetical protein